MNVREHRTASVRRGTTRPARQARVPIGIFALAAASPLFHASPSLADVVTITADRDNTIYVNPNLGNNASNGAGIKLFTGSNALGEPRRALLHFDVASAVPAGATVTKVTLTLFLDKSLSDPGTVSVHRLTADWGEGASNAGDPGGQGVAAAPGDATWNFRFFNNAPWNTVGGDFVSIPSASAFQSPFVGSKTWSSDGMLADVQDWLVDPASNFGWIVIGEEFLTTTARRYSSRETANAQSRPRLTIEFTPCKVDFDGTGFVDGDDFDAYVRAFEAGEITADFDGTGFVDTDDFDAFVLAFEQGC